MIVGIGVDLIEIERIQLAIKHHGDRFLKRIFTPKEIEYCKSLKELRFPELAARFAAKEAYSKAIGTGMAGIGWTDIEVSNDEKGKPFLIIHGEKRKDIHITITHSKNYSIAMVVIESCK